MTKITISVCKVYKNTGSFRFHRKNTKPAWKHYFLDDETGELEFKTEWISSFKALILKNKVYKKRTFVCEECGIIFEGLIKKNSDWCECPKCP